jgi:hypothetical protein
MPAAARLGARHTTDSSGPPTRSHRDPASSSLALPGGAALARLLVGGGNKTSARPYTIPLSVFFGKHFSRSVPNPQRHTTRHYATLRQVLTRRSEPITLLAKRGHRHLQTQKLALVVITQEAEAHTAAVSAQSHSHTLWVLLHTEQLHPSPRLSSHSQLTERPNFNL